MASHGISRASATAEKSEAERQEELREIAAYKELEDLINAKIAERTYTLEVLDLTSKLLRKNPEYYTIWNVRRRLLIYSFSFKPSASSSPLTVSQITSSTATTTASSGEPSSSSPPPIPTLLQNTSGTPPVPESQSPGKNGTILELIKADLEFLFPLMMKWPKCYWLWNYRLWLLQQANERLEVDIARDLWNRELVLVGKMLVKDSRNFHGWGYRRKVVSELESPALKGKSMVESEFEYTTKMIHGDRGLSNFSAWHRRSKLIPRMLDERGASHAERQQFLDDEFDLIVSAMYTDSYPYAQSAWFYYQCLMTTLTDPVGHDTMTPNFTSTDRSEYVTRQLAILTDMLDGAEDCKWIYSALIEYTLALARMEERTPRPDELEDCTRWLGELRSLDPLRSGRWDALGKTFRRL